jgi:hypothetical protein
VASNKTILKQPHGRPSPYKPEYDEMLVEHMSQGFSFESFAGLVSVCRATVYNWCDLYPSFLDAKNLGFSKMQLHDERLYLEAMRGKNKNVNTVLMLFKMKNCHNWTERTEQAKQIDNDSKLVIELDSSEFKSEN